MEFEYCVVEAFTDRRYRGNPAAVVFGADALDGPQMVAIAREFNLSETAFIFPPDVPDAAVRFRWFTPAMEVKLCGHATLAAVHAMVERGRFAALRSGPQTLLPIPTASGTLTARMEKMPTADDAWLVWLDLPTPRLSPIQLNADRLARLLGTTLDAIDRSLPMMRTQDGDVLLFLNDLPTLQSLVPEYNGLRDFSLKQRIRGFCVATLNTLADSIHVQSRFFAPAAGVPEDPVTGSVHGPLATYLVVNELVPFHRNTAAVHCVQAEPGGRAGSIRAMVTQHPGEGYSVRIAGQCVTTMRGKLTV